MHSPCSGAEPLLASVGDLAGNSPLTEGGLRGPKAQLVSVTKERATAGWQSISTSVSVLLPAAALAAALEVLLSKWAEIGLSALMLLLCTALMLVLGWLICSSGDGTSGKGEPEQLVVRCVQGSSDKGGDCLLLASRLDGRGRLCLPAAKLLKACRGSSG